MARTEESERWAMAGVLPLDDQCCGQVAQAHTHSSSPFLAKSNLKSESGPFASGIFVDSVPSKGATGQLRQTKPEPQLILDEPTKALGRQILNLVRQENIGGVIARARRLEAEAPELGIRLEDENGSLYLRYGDDRVQIRRPAPSEGVRYAGEFGAEIGTTTGHPLPVRIDVETISRLAAYIERL